MWINVPEQKRVIARYGADAQAMIHAEELAELIQSVSKMRRAVNTLYGRDFDPAAAFGPYAGIAQQYLFYYAQSGRLQSDRSDCQTLHA